MAQSGNQGNDPYIQISPAHANVQIGETQNLTATEIASGSSVDVTNEATWTSMHEAVVKVSSSGVVTTMGPGSALITASYNKVTGTPAVITASDIIESITATATPTTLEPGQATQLKAVATYKSGKKADVTEFVEWGGTHTSDTVTNGNPPQIDLSEAVSLTQTGQPKQSNQIYLRGVNGVWIPEHFGTNSITASLQGVVSAPVEVTVSQDITSLYLWPESMLISPGSTCDLPTVNGVS